MNGLARSCPTQQAVRAQLYEEPLNRPLGQGWRLCAQGESWHQVLPLHLVREQGTDHDNGNCEKNW
jgi:hypothetical protein